MPPKRKASTPAPAPPKRGRGHPPRVVSSVPPSESEAIDVGEAPAPPRKSKNIALKVSPRSLVALVQIQTKTNAKRDKNGKPLDVTTGPRSATETAATKTPGTPAPPKIPKAPLAPARPKVNYVSRKPFPGKGALVRNDFPLLANGSIFIALDDEVIQVYKLEATVLNRTASFFKDDEGAECPEPCLELAKQMEHKYAQGAKIRRYELIEDERGEWVLGRVPITAKVEPPKPVMAPESAQVEEQNDGDKTNEIIRQPNQQVGEQAENRKGISIANAASFQVGQPVGRSEAKSDKPVGNTVQAGKSIGGDHGMFDNPFVVIPRGCQGSGAAAVAGSTSESASDSVDDGSSQSSVKQEAKVEIKSELNTEPGVNSNVGDAQARPTIKLGGNGSRLDEVMPDQDVNGRNILTIDGFAYFATPLTATAAPQPEHDDHSRSQSKDKEEDEDEAEEEETSQEVEPYVEIDQAGQLPFTRGEMVNAFSTLFQLFYNRFPTTAITDIPIALRHCEALFVAAKSIGAETIGILTFYINNVFMLFGQSVYPAIYNEPLRWLKFTANLRNAVFFREAMVHVVGAWPDSPTDSYRKMLGEKVYVLVERKAMDLRSRICRINEQLFTSSLSIDGQRVGIDPDNKTTFDTWFVVQVWRHWFSDNIGDACQPRLVGYNPRIHEERKGFDSFIKLGTVLRTVGQGGEAYLDTEELKMMLRRFTPSPLVGGKNARIQSHDRMKVMQWNDVDKDLNMLRAYAREELVKSGLLTNASGLRPEEAGIHYLTCTTVDDSELPWIPN